MERLHVQPPVDAARLGEWLNVSTDDICFAFVYGSRLYGTARPDSDWDIYVILYDYVGPLAKPDIPDGGIPEILIEKQVENVMVDVHVVVRSNWQSHLDRNFVPAISSLTLPTSAIIKPFKPGTFNFELCLMKIKHEVDKFKGAHEEISLRLFKQGKHAKGKKILVHPLRVLEYGIQILNTGGVYDFEAGNKYKKELDSIDLDSQEKARLWLYEKVYHLDEAFRAVVNVYKYISPINCDPLPVDRYKEIPALLPFIAAAEAAAPTLHVIRDEDADPKDVFACNYIKERCKDHKEGVLSLTELNREISVGSMYLQGSNQHLVQLSLDPKYAPRQSKVSDQACGLVLNSHDEWRPVGYGFKRFVSAQGAEEHLPLLDWSSVVLTKKLNGVTVNLFQHNDEWVTSFYFGHNLLGKQIEWKVQDQLRRELKIDVCSYEEQKEVARRISTEINRAFWEVWRRLGYRLPTTDEPTRTYIFILQHCQYSDEQAEMNYDDHFENIVAVGARDMASMRELNGSELGNIAETHGWKHISLPQFSLGSILQKPGVIEAIRVYNETEEKEAKLAQQGEIFKLIQKEIECLDWMEYEGAVACDSQFRRITFNTKRYDTLEKLDPYLPYNQKQRLFYDLIKDLYDDPSRVRRFCALVPQWANWLLYVQDNLNRFLAEIDVLYDQVKHITERKDLARAIAPHSKDQKAFLFSLHKGEFSRAVEYWRCYRDQGPNTKALAVAIFTKPTK